MYESQKYICMHEQVQLHITILPPTCTIPQPKTRTQNANMNDNYIKKRTILVIYQNRFLQLWHYTPSTLEIIVSNTVRGSHIA